MIISPDFQFQLEQELSEYFNQRILITDSERLYGGDINDSFLVNSSAGKLFIKINSTTVPHDFFEKELRGLEDLQRSNCIKVPQPFFSGNSQNSRYLVTEFLEKGNAGPDFWEDFGNSLATLHRNTRPIFGLDYDNFIGRLPQSNVINPSWIEFYSEQRILKLCSEAHNSGLLSKRSLDDAFALCSKLESLIPSEPSALLHGDLWAGNFMVRSDGKAAIYDPAVYYGHREIDIAMTKLFGGFDKKLYLAYQASYPLEKGWEERLDIFQLYPLLVHLVLFGGHYADSVANILARYR